MVKYRRIKVRNVGEIVKKCLIVINKKSGSYEKMPVAILEKVFGKGFETEIFYIEEGHPFEYMPTDRVVICGGDGTFNSVLNLYRKRDTEIIYCPCGTLNETSKRDVEGTGDFLIADCGEADEKFFSYVLATGVFTPLGYAVNNKVKQKYKAFAYIANTVKQLKVWRIRAKLNVDGENREGEYSLLMFLDSAQCFGLTFNKMFRPNREKLYMLSVKAPRFDGFFGLAELFFPFFRAFFIGFKKPFHSKKMDFQEIHNVTVETDRSYDFCVDGEKWTMPLSYSVCPYPLNPPIRVVSDKVVRSLSEKE